MHIDIDAYKERAGRVDLEGIDWVVVGGESGPGYRPMKLEWARHIRSRCQALDVAFFFKQDSGPRTEMRPDALGRIIREFPKP